MRDVRDRKDMLLEAGLTLASELSLPIVLQRIVDLAAQVADARYGAPWCDWRQRHPGRVCDHRHLGQGAAGDWGPADRPRRARSADTRSETGSDHQHRGAPPLGWLSTQPSADALIPWSAGAGHGSGF